MADRPLVAVSRAGLPGDPAGRLEQVARVRVGPPASSGDLSPAGLARLCAGADGLLCTSTDRVDAELLDACPGLRVVASISVGQDHLDLAELRRRGIAVATTPGVLHESVADLTFGLIIAAMRRITEGDRLVRDARWRGLDLSLLLGHDVHGATLGLVGFGAIAQAVARRARGFEMTVVHTSRTPGASSSLSSWMPLDDLLRAADVVSVHAPLTTATRGLIGARELALMKGTAVLVNTARGGVVDQVALYEALRDGRLFAAGLDVFASEPPDDDPLLGLDNCVTTPHIGSASMATRTAMAELAVANVAAALTGEPLPTPI